MAFHMYLVLYKKFNCSWISSVPWCAVRVRTDVDDSVVQIKYVVTNAVLKWSLFVCIVKLFYYIFYL